MRDETSGPADVCGGDSLRFAVVVDGSVSSQRAATYAAELASRCAAEIVVIHVYSPRYPFRNVPLLVSGKVYDAQRQRATELLKDEWCRPVREANIPYQLVIAQGHPVQALVTAALRFGCTLIVTGPLGGGIYLARPWEKWRKQLALRSPIPVILYPVEPIGLARLLRQLCTRLDPYRMRVENLPERIEVVGQENAAGSRRDLKIILVEDGGARRKRPHEP